MAPSIKVQKAFSAMRSLGIRDEVVKPVLKTLLKLYENKWELIEEDNYRTLADAIFEESERIEATKEGTLCQTRSEPPPKRLHLEEQEASSAVDKSSSTAVQGVCDISPTSGGLEVVESSQLRSGDCRTGSSSHQSQALSSAIRKYPTSSQLTTRHRRTPSNKVSTALCSDQSMNEQQSVQMQTKEVPPPASVAQSVLPSSLEPTSTGYNSAIIKSSLEVNVDDHRVHHHPTIPKKSALDPGGIKNHPHTKEVSCHGSSSSRSLVVFEQQPAPPKERRISHKINDITKGLEKVKISLVDEIGCENLPEFFYIPQNTVYQDAYLHFSLARVADEDCCPRCKGSCLSSSIPCACARETGGEFAYTRQGLLREEFLSDCISIRQRPQSHHFFYCQDCPLERSYNDEATKPCKGHLMRRFIKECWRKCGCHMQCGNRVVQRGITCNLQVFFTAEGKGWGLRTLKELPKGTFVCEYVGEILTNIELYKRNEQRSKERHTYPVLLDADWGSEEILKDEEALCLDATLYGNVARFVNHRCVDANLLDIPVAVETPDHHYYHVAFFTSRKVEALEELSWDYGIDFDDHNHPIKAFQCCCGSTFCRDKKRGSMSSSVKIR